METIGKGVVTFTPLPGRRKCIAGPFLGMKAFLQFLRPISPAFQPGCALGRDPGTMILVTPKSLAMTRFLATVEKMKAKIVPGAGTLWFLPQPRGSLSLYTWVLTVAVSGILWPAPNQRPRKSWSAFRKGRINRSACSAYL